MKNKINDSYKKYIEARDDKSFKKLFLALDKPLKSFLRGMFKSDDDVREVFLLSISKMYSNIDKFNSKKSSFTTWVYTICKNTALDYKKEQSRYKLVENFEQKEGLMSPSANVETKYKEMAHMVIKFMATELSEEEIEISKVAFLNTVCRKEFIESKQLKESYFNNKVFNIRQKIIKNFSDKENFNTFKKVKRFNLTRELVAIEV